MITTTHYDIDWLKEKFDSGNPLKYVFFWGHTNKENEAAGKFCFSQWFETPFTVDGITYKTAEHWMMTHKALLFGDNVMLEKIIACNTPGEAKKFGRQVQNYDGQIWDEKKRDIVNLGNIHKFNQYPIFADYLLKTGDKVLVEASPTDNIWGIGMSQNNKEVENVHAWRGQNLLGFALMSARDFLSTFGHFKPLDTPVKAPWTTFPNIDPQDTFWKTGQGADCLAAFSSYYQGLTDREKTIYQLNNPNPYSWINFYQ